MPSVISFWASPFELFSERKRLVDVHAMGSPFCESHAHKSNYFSV